MDEFTETRLNALFNAVTSLEKRLNTLEVKVGRLEVGPPLSAFDVVRRDELIDAVDPHRQQL